MGMNAPESLLVVGSNFELRDPLKISWRGICKRLLHNQLPRFAYDIVNKVLRKKV